MDIRPILLEIWLGSSTPCVIHQLGRGVPQDFVQAHMWDNLAAAHGETRSAEARDALAQRMTPAQIAEAQKLAREWKAKAP